ncbi:hypothetical protein X777_06280 [Ooceraea biroi]|uniref:Uncharacterized protein n=1 Tax=Ooceraea biroi TaxID=2015173 RepID=A0A026WC17_OOCBI|nr:hypothetical protein X777_06280 [Ooceraea biroi]
MIVVTVNSRGQESRARLAKNSGRKQNKVEKPERNVVYVERKLPYLNRISVAKTATL